MISTNCTEYIGKLKALLSPRNRYVILQDVTLGFYIFHHFLVRSQPALTPPPLLQFFKGGGAIEPYYAKFF